MSDNQSDVGFKIAKPFFNVNTAGDADLILNSSWPTLQIAFEQTVPVLITSTGATTFTYSASVTHNLQFPPFTCAWGIYSDGTTERLVYIEKNTSSIAQFSITNSIASVSGSGDTAQAAFNMTSVHFKCYNLDISKDVEYPFVKPPQQQTSIDSDFGIKMVKEGKSLDSKDMRDYIIHSRCQSPLVLAVKTEKTAAEDHFGGTVTYKSPYTYLSWVFGYMKSGSTYRSVPSSAQSYPKLIIDPLSFTYSLQHLNASGDDGASIVVLRDPFFTTSDSRVAY